MIRAQHRSKRPWRGPAAEAQAELPQRRRTGWKDHLCSRPAADARCGQANAQGSSSGLSSNVQPPPCHRGHVGDPPAVPSPAPPPPWHCLLPTRATASDPPARSLGRGFIGTFHRVPAAAEQSSASPRRTGEPPPPPPSPLCPPPARRGFGAALAPFSLYEAVCGGNRLRSHRCRVEQCPCLRAGSRPSASPVPPRRQLPATGGPAAPGSRRGAAGGGSATRVPRSGRAGRQDRGGIPAGGGIAPETPRRPPGPPPFPAPSPARRGQQPPPAGSHRRSPPAPRSLRSPPGCSGRGCRQHLPGETARPLRSQSVPFCHCRGL